MHDQPEEKPTLDPSAAPEQSPNDTPVNAPKPSKSRAILVVVILIVIALLAAGTYLFLGKKDSKQSGSAPKTTEAKPKLSIYVKESGVLVLPNGHADPTVLPTATGYRMYVNRQSGGPSGILIYNSPDGITWTKEKDIVIAGASTSRAINVPSGGVRIYYPGTQPIRPTDPQANMLSSFSTDGLTFAKDPGSVLQPRSNEYYVEGPTVFQLPDNGWRMYFNENSIAAGNNRDGEIWGASSADGTTWKRDEKVTLQAGDEESNPGGRRAHWKQVLHPFVLKNPKGGYIMFYNSHSEIFAATSSDGLSWEKLGAIGIHAADIDGYFQEDGTVRVYYGDFSEQTGGLVYMAVLQVK